MINKNLVPLTIAALAVVAVSMPADAKGWGNGNIPPGIAKKLYGYAGSNGYGNSFFGNGGGFGGGNGFFGNANGFGGGNGFFGNGSGFGGGCGGNGFGSGFGGGMGGNFQNGFGGHHGHHHGHHGQNSFGNNSWGNNWGNNNWGNNNWGNNNWRNGWNNNNGTGANNLSWLTNRLTNRQQRLQSLLSNGNLSPDRAARIQNELTQIQNAQGSITAGNFNPNSFGGLRGLLGF